MERKEVNEKWVRCPKCGHKLFKTVGYNEFVIESGQFADGMPKITKDLIEIKCHSCKEIVRCGR